MNSIILMRKLLTVKLDHTEFDKIKMRQANINQKKHKVLNSLKRILDNQALVKTCRLCLKSGGKNIFGGDQDFDLALTIKNCLGVEITENDGKPQHICGACENVLRQVVRLKETAETTQWRLQQELDMLGDADAGSDYSDGPELHGGHFKTGNSNVTREWLCSKCRTTFHTLQEFTAHEQQPTCKPLQYYVCDTCGLEVKSLPRLQRHKEVHTTSLPYPCTSCPYRARTIYALRVHSRQHSGARPERCPHCPAQFASASNLASHKRKHLPPRYHCSVCQKGFNFREALNNHMASQHSNAKPYNCNICGKAFATRKMTLRHELKVHNRPKMRIGTMPSYIRIQEEANVLEQG